MKIKTTLLLTTLSTGLLAGSAQAQIAGAIRPGDGVGGLNLTSYTNTWQTTLAVEGTDFDGKFTSGFDMFHIAKRDASLFIANAVKDDSISVFPTDTFGIVDETDNDPFFAAGDTRNNDNLSNALLVADWTFDITSASSDVAVSIDLAAMGDFEGPASLGSQDIFRFSYSIDGGAFVTLGQATVFDTGDAENGSGPTGIPGQLYTLANGTNTNTLNDPLDFLSTRLTNNFATINLGTIAGSASASSLTLRFEADTDGGDEYFLFRNLVIDVPTGNPADLDNDGDVDDADFGIAFAAFTGPGNGPSLNPAADLDLDGDVDDADFGIAFAAFTGPGGGPVSVPEPTSLALLGLGGLLIARRRRA